MVDGEAPIAYHSGMPGARVHWTLVFTAASLEHLAERQIEAADVVEAVYGQHGPARVRRAGRGDRQRWFVIAPLESGELLTASFGQRFLGISRRWVPSSFRMESERKLRSGLIHRCACASVLECLIRMRSVAIADGVGAREGTNAYGDTEED